jgi:carbonic anhydrase
MSVAIFIYKTLIGVLLLGLVQIPVAAGEGESAEEAVIQGADQWSYSGQTGPSNWAGLSDAYSTCATGQHQSPVDISITKHTYLPPLSFQYRTSVLSINREGVSVWIDYDSGSYLKIRGKRYRFIGFDFHTPGEHSFNGKTAEMEIHLHHLDAQGKRLIVAIPVVSGHRNNITLSRIWEHIPKYNSLRQYRRIGINPIFLLPSDRSYALYSGSETKPPCEENVLWIVFTNPLKVSSKDISRFHSIIGNNARPVQPLNDRVIVQSGR